MATLQGITIKSGIDEYIVRPFPLHSLIAQPYRHGVSTANNPLDSYETLTFDNTLKGLNGVLSLENSKDESVTFSEGKFGNCVNFNENSGLKGDFDWNGGKNTPFSLSLWIKCDNLLEMQGILPLVVINTQDFGSFFSAVVPYYTGNYSLYINNLMLNIGANLDWTHICYTHYPMFEEKKLYVNGVLVDTGNEGERVVQEENDYIAINDILNMSYRGSIDQLRIYDRVLTPAEVIQLYNEARPLIVRSGITQGVGVYYDGKSTIETIKRQDIRTKSLVQNTAEVKHIILRG